MLPTCSVSLLAMPATTIRDQSYELLHIDESTLAKHLKTRLLLCAIKGALG
ncbi:MAG: hypothetical protein AVDCRST_MAG80-1680 [uncultured Rubrobacteraceae bacterium]|uniref:Uncharacterized protein n=1 Tax=uncultured Rubrobacteraceae bacterium TaxID=349277 RepID=A0A6J4QMD7_9ACTN|nr:MAG: hypothetical protein AVDCRST_MAG80-1680 [uncultured Rubrobacteraceae bacterium]